MKIRFRYWITSLIIAAGCQNIEDAEPAGRSTFVRFYEAAHSLSGVTAEQTADGFIILGNEKLANGNLNTILIRTNQYGQKISNDIVIEHGFAKGMMVTPDGYYIIGDSIKTNLESSEIPVFDLLTYSARLFKLDLDGNIINKIVFADKKETTNITDIHGDAITMNGSNELIVLGTYKPAGNQTTEKPYLVSLHPTTFDTLWTKSYDALDRDYVNAKSIHVTSSQKIIWATSLLKENQNFSKSYMSVPLAQPQSVFTNFDIYGELTDQRIYPNDIQPASLEGLGYGVVGTFSNSSGALGSANIFFMLADPNGNINANSVKFYDGELSVMNESVSETISASEDTGNAITATSDGNFIIGGSMTTTVNRGNGGQDIFLLKIDTQGNILWNKIIGGEGNETVSSIRETSDGDLIICGTNELSGLASIFFMKTDKNGELTK